MKSQLALFNALAEEPAYFTRVLGPHFELTQTAEPFSPATVHLATGAEVLSVRSASQITAELMAKMPELRHIACRTTGFDNIDLAYAKGRGITISTVPDYGEATVAEYTFLVMMAVARKLMLTAHATRFGPVVQDKLAGHDLTGKTLGLVGTGRIGRHVASIGRGFGMTVVAYDPFPNPGAAGEIGYRYAPLPEVLAAADYLTLHAPATPDTHHLLNTKTLAELKSGVFVVNTARSSLIDLPALIAALDTGHVAGAALDVFETATAAEITNLTERPNVLLTAHNGYNTVEALARIRQGTAANIKAWQAGTPQNLVALDHV